MTQPQYSHGNLRNMFGIGSTADPLEPVFGGPGSRSELKSLSDSEMGKMAINLLIVKNFTLKNDVRAD